jgi:hypothetical protein
MDVFDTMLAEINDLTKMVAILHQDYGDKGLETWLTNQDVCRILNINKRTLQTYRDTGQLPFSRIIRTFYYKPEDVEKLLINSKEQKTWK